MSTVHSDTVLKVCLFTDLVGSMELKSRLGDAVAAARIAEHNAAFRASLAAFNGTEEKSTGDGFFATFDRPSDAVRCALAFQDTLLSAPAGARLSARVGIHMGEITRLDPGDTQAAQPELLGLAIDTSARVMGLAQGGQILLTRHTFDSVRQQVQTAPDGSVIECHAHGPYVFKGVDEPLEIFEVGVRGRSPMSAPPDSEKARRAIAPGDEETLGWRPALGLSVPGRPGWELEQQIGQGGFGEVWTARHLETDEVRAFKFCFHADRLRTLKREMTLFRLLKEALGERGDIARLYEVRLDEPPYFLEMEYTEGGGLPDWIRHRGGVNAVPLATRLDIVAQVGEALAAAHSVGVIHKDVKPQNVLMFQRRNEPPRVRLTDFGIGHVTSLEVLREAGLGATAFDCRSTVLTELSSRTGTRLYMAPELLAGRPPSTRSDIYALGVTLYQLVVGDLERPLAQGWEQDVPDELVREDIATCVAGPPEHRWATADALSASLRALDQRREERAAQRRQAEVAGRRRRRRQWVRAASVVLALLAVTAGVGFFAERAQRIRAQRAEEQQRRQRRNAERIADFMGRLLAGVKASKALGRDTTMLREMLDEVARRIEGGELGDSPEAELRLRWIIGEAYIDIAEGGAAQRAEEFLLPTLALAERTYGAQSAEMWRSLTKVGICLSALGRSADALLNFEAAKELSQRLYKGDHVHVASSLINVASSLRSLGRADEALLKFDVALDMRKRIYKGDHLDVAQGMSSVAACLESLGRSAEALPMLEAALAMRRRLQGEDHPDVAVNLNNVGACLQSLDRHGDALQKYETALVMFRHLYKRDHPDLALSLNNVGSCLEHLGRSAEALHYYEAALEMLRRIYGGDHPSVARGFNNLGSCQASLKRYAEALPNYAAALEMFQHIHTGDHPDVASALNNVGACLKSLGRPAEALPKLESGLKMVQRIYKGDHPAVASGLMNVGVCLKSLGRASDALPMFEAALEMRQRLYAGDHSNVASSLELVGDCLVTLDRRAEAIQTFEAALNMRQRLCKGDHQDIASSLIIVGYCLRDLGRLPEALSKFECALEMRRRLYKGDHEAVVASLMIVCNCLNSLNRATEALPIGREAVAMSDRHPNWPAYVHRPVLQTHCRTLVALGMATEAGSVLKKELALARSQLPPNSDELAGALAGASGLLLSCATNDAARIVEPWLRECLSICERHCPDGSPMAWKRFYSMSMLGEALMRSQHDEAESARLTDEAWDEIERLLTNGQAGLEGEVERIPASERARVRAEALTRLVDFYEARHRAAPQGGFDAQAESWRARLAEYQATTQAAAASQPAAAAASSP